MRKQKVKPPLNNKIKFIPCDENRQIYSYTRTDKKSAQIEIK